jgi:hypothetical protein
MTNISSPSPGAGGDRASGGAQRFELPKWECFELLRREGIGRLCIVDHGYPVAFPVNYRMHGVDDAITAVVRTAPGTVMGQYEGPASLEVDHIDLVAGTAWSVIVRGALRRVVGTHTLPDPQPILTQGRDRWVELVPTAITGRRFTVRVSDDGFPVEWQLVMG